MTDVSVTSRAPSELPLTERQWVRRGELLEAARVVFERQGYHAATVSAIVQAALHGYLAGKVELHFLPPYCPDHNRIERVWQDVHANVTRNHRCADMAALLREVRYYLRKRNRRKQRVRGAA